MPVRRGHAPASAPRLAPDLAALLLLLLLSVVCAVEAQTPVRIGVYQNPPKVFIDASGMAAGFFVDVIDAIAARAGWQPHYVPCEWQRCLADVATGRLDLMVDVAETSERQARLRFGREAVLSSWSELYRASGDTLQTILDTHGRRIGVLAAGIQGPALLAEAALYDITPQLVTFASFEAAFSALARGDVDAVLADRLHGMTNAPRHGAEPAGVLLRPSLLKLVSALDADPRLLDGTDTHLRALKADADSAYHAAVARWLGPPRSAQLPAWLGWGAAAIAVLVGALLLIIVQARRDVARKSVEMLEQAELQHDLARRDSLTGLVNRLGFLEQSAQASALGAERGLALLCVDIDRFKNVNESLGHTAGDRVLMQVAERLLAGREPGELVARLGADEFALLLPGSHDTDALARKARTVMAALAVPLSLDAQTFNLSASIGIARLPEDAADAGGLLMHADAAVGRAKREGRGQFAFSAPALTEQAYARLRLENRLRHALTAREFSLAYQPQVDLDTGRVTGIEALLRWTPVDGEALSPARFIPVAEAMGLMPELGAWVLDEALGQARVWRDAALGFGRMAVNVSTSQLRRADFSATVRRALQAHGLSADCLELEITEGVLDTRFEGLGTHLDELRELGVSLAIDDFGTGYSSLARLRRLPVAVLKLDKSFVDGLPESGEDLAVARTVLALASALSLQVVAEGVERESQGEALRAIGCRCAQGYLYSRPLDAAAATAWLRAATARSG